MTTEQIYVIQDLRYSAGSYASVGRDIAAAIGLKVRVQATAAPVAKWAEPTPGLGAVLAEIEAWWQPHATRPGEEPATEFLLKERAKERSVERNHEKLHL